MAEKISKISLKVLTRQVSLYGAYAYLSLFLGLNWLFLIPLNFGNFYQQINRSLQLLNTGPLGFRVNVVLAAR